MLAGKGIRLSHGLACAGVVFTFVLTGCGLGSAGSGASGTGIVNQVHKISGSLHGGQQPLAGAYVQLYAVGSNGYGTSAAPLIPTTTVGDGSIQSIIVTDSSGGFNIDNDYTCPSPDTQVYLTAVGGNPGLSAGTNNTSSAIIAALGACGNLGYGTYVNMNEVTTVAAIWALNGFTSVDTSTNAHGNNNLYWGGGACSTYTGNGTSGNAYKCIGQAAATGFSIGAPSTNTQGLINAFLTSAILADTTAGSSPGLNTNGYYSNIESWNVNAIANILSSCVNSTGIISSGQSCSSLFTAAAVNGVTPSDTLQAAYLMASHPTNNVAAIYALATGTPPFDNAASAMNDFTIGYQIVANFNDNLASPIFIAFDKYGNAFVSNLDLRGTNAGGVATAPYIPFITEYSPTGAPLTKITGYFISPSTFQQFGHPYTDQASSTATYSNNHPMFMAFDQSNNLYAYDEASGYISQIPGSTGAGVASPWSSTDYTKESVAINTGLTGNTSGSTITSMLQGLVYDGVSNLWLTESSTGNAVPGWTKGTGQVYSFPVSAFSSNSGSVTPVNFASNSGSYNLVVDNTTSSTYVGAPFVYIGDTSLCVSGTTLPGNTTYGTLQVLFAGSGTASGSGSSTTVTQGTPTPFSPVVDSDLSGKCTLKTGLPTITSTYGSGNTVEPIALPYALAVDSGNNIWLMNELDAASSSALFPSFPDLSLTKLVPAYSTNSTTGALTVSYSAFSGTGGGLQNSNLKSGGANAYTSMGIAVDGSGNVFVPTLYVTAEFNSSAVAVSNSNGLTGGTLSNSKRNTTYTYRTLSIDRSGNVWLPASQSNGATILVLVGAATPVYTPLIPPYQGARP